MSTEIIDKQLWHELQPFLDEKDEAGILSVLENYRAEDIADIFWNLEDDDNKYLIGILEKSTAVDVIRSLDEELQENLLKKYDAEEIAVEIVSFLDSDDSVDLLNLLPTRKAEEVLSFLEDQEYAKSLTAMLHYDDDVAGGLMAKELVQVKHNWTVSQCIEEIRLQAEEVSSVHA